MTDRAHQQADKAFHRAAPRSYASNQDMRQDDFVEDELSNVQDVHMHVLHAAVSHPHPDEDVKHFAQVMLI